MTDTHFHQQTFPLKDASDSVLQELETQSSQSFTESNQHLPELSQNSMSSNYGDSILESDSSLNTSKSGKKGELGTRGLQRVSSRKRRAILKSCSIELDPKEAAELREIRESRESVGCQCYGGRCEDCQCAGAEVQCHQVIELGVK